jgi:predicted N-formylglutamate amidohydrolase
MTAFEHIPARDAASPLLLLCDHASAALPEGYGRLGLDPALFETHIAHDIGAAQVTRTLAGHFGAAAVLGRWSRLLVDLNRGADDPTLVMKLSDGSIIPGNRAAGPDEIARRIRDFHAPYHAAITAELDRIEAFLPCARESAQAGEGEGGVQPSPNVAGPRASEGRRGQSRAAIISIHSFTPAWKGQARPWEVGVLWDKDRRLAGPLMSRLSQHAFVWGDNEPYSGALENDCLSRHGTRRGLAHVLVEIRQDLIGTDADARSFAHKLAFVLSAALGDMERLR